MPRRQAFDSFAFGERRSGESYFSWLYRELTRAIRHRALPAGMRLPAERVMARRLGLSRGTVSGVLDQLTTEGLVVARQRSGRYVGEGFAEGAASPRRSGGNEPRLSRRAHKLLAEPVVAANTERAGTAFQPFAAPLDCFPHRAWLHAVYRARSRDFPERVAHADPLGYRPLRKAVAGHLGLARGISADPEQIAIVPSTQAALDLLARLLLDPGECAAVEQPGNPVAAALMEAAGATIQHLTVDEQGLDPAALDQRSPRLIYTTPAHQLPLGVTLSPPRRERLLDEAARRGAWIFEDDFDADFQYAGHAVPSLHASAPDDLVIYAGSFRKALFPAVRTAYLVLPDALVEPYARAAWNTFQDPALLTQSALTQFIDDGHYGRHLRLLHDICLARQNALIEAARPSGTIDVSPVNTGMNTVGWLARGVDDREAEAALAAAGVQSLALSRYGRIDGQHAGLHLGFAGANPMQIRQAMKKAARALERLAASSQDDEPDVPEELLGSSGSNRPGHAGD